MKKQKHRIKSWEEVLLQGRVELDFSIPLDPAGKHLPKPAGHEFREIKAPEDKIQLAALKYERWRAAGRLVD